MQKMHLLEFLPERNDQRLQWVFDPGFKIITVCLSQPKFEYF